MSEERIEKLEKSLVGLRKQVDLLGRVDRDTFASMRYAVFGCVVAGALLAFTATTWRTTGGEDGIPGDATTLWGMAGEGWQAAATLILAGLVAIGTIGVYLADAEGPRSYYVCAVLALLLMVAVFLAGEVEPAGFYDPEDASSAPGRWLTLLAAVVLGCTHLVRGTELRER
jgi:hypothetical protein